MRVCVYVNFHSKWATFDFFSPNQPKNGFKIFNSENYCWNKNQHPQNLGLKFEKTNMEIRIIIFEILCVYVRVCQFSGKTHSSDFFSPNLPKNGFRVGNSENYCRNKNHHPWYTMRANFQSKWTTLNFLVQICPKKDLGLETEKSNVGIRINIVETLCVPIFSQTRQLWLFWSKFAQRWI